MPTRRPRTDLSALPERVRGLKHRDRAVRLEAAAALARLGPEATPAVPALAGALQDGDVHVRKMAALALGDIGPDAEGAVPDLTDALRDGHAGVRRRACQATLILPAQRQLECPIPLPPREGPTTITFPVRPCDWHCLGERWSAIVSSPGETEAGSAGTQPDRGIARPTAGR
jgi:hypothetical protein